MHDADRDILLPKWHRPDSVFDIPDELKERFAFLKRSPHRGAPAQGSGPVSTVARTYGTIVGAYQNALLVGSPVGKSERQFLGWAYMAIAVAFFFPMIYILLDNIVQISLGDLSGANIIGVMMFAVLLGVDCLFIMWCYNAARRSPSDWPIMFNRVSRQIAYFEVGFPTFFRFWSPVRAKLVIRSWEQAHFRTYKTIQFTGAWLKEASELVLLWGDEKNQKRLADVVRLGETFNAGDEPCIRLWEHIRRYMEEDGPVLNDGESLRKPTNDNPPLRFPKHLEEAAGGAPLSAEQIEAMRR